MNEAAPTIDAGSASRQRKVPMSDLKTGDIVTIAGTEPIERGYGDECVILAIVPEDEDGPEGAELSSIDGDYAGEIVELSRLKCVQSAADERKSRPSVEQVTRAIEYGVQHVNGHVESGPVAGNSFPVAFTSESGHAVSAMVSITEVMVMPKGGL